MLVPTFRDQAVVLRSIPLKEADRIVTLLTRSHGQIRAVVHGARKTSSRIGSRLDPLNLVDIQLRVGHGDLHTVEQVETQEAFGSVLTADFSKWTIGQAMAETAERLTYSEAATQQFLLIVAGLRALVGQERDPSLVCDSYFIRSMAVAGWASSFTTCARCETPGPHRWFSIGAGGSLCADCRLPGAATPAPETLVLLGALLAGDWPTADATPAKFRSEATGIVVATMQWHLERELKSVKHVDRQARGVVRAV